MKNIACQPTFSASEVELRKDTLVYEGFFKVRQLELRHRCFNGSWSPFFVREQVRRRDAAAVLLYDPLLDQIILVEQLRIGPLGAGEGSPWLLEIVAGLIEDHETAQTTILREAQEEAQCTILKLIYIMDYYNSPGGVAEKTTLFCGIVNAPEKGGYYGILQEHEDIKTHIIPREVAVCALLDGELRSSASTIIALQWLERDLRQNTLFWSSPERWRA